MKRKIKRIIIDNFQSHKHSEINLDDFTVIIGPTDSGKSAIIRAIRWCLYNDVDNNSFIREGEKSAEVKVEFVDGRKIIRHRGADENSYTLVAADGSEVKLTAFGGGTVPEVMQFHGMFEANLFGEPQNLNVASQLESPFFLAESPARKAMMIGQIANTDIIDLAIEKAAQDIRSEKAKEKTLRGELKKADAELKDYRNLPVLRMSLEKIEKHFEELTNRNGELSTLVSRKAKLISLNSDRTKIIERVKHEYAVERAKTDIVRIEEAMVKMAKLKSALRQLENGIETIQTLIKSINLTTPEELEILSDKIKSVIDAMQKRDKLTYALKNGNRNIAERRKASEKLDVEPELAAAENKINICLRKIRDTEPIRSKQSDLTNQFGRLTKGNQMIRDLEIQYSNAMQEYRDALAANPLCPVCQSEITTEKLSSISI